jgi:RNA polymerase sigma-B factor
MSDKPKEQLRREQLKQESEALFAEYARTRSEETRNRIVELYLYLAEILSKKYTGRGIDYDDLFQVASMALVLAVERFDPSKGFAFSSFATPTIIGEIKRYFRDKSWAVKVPRRVKELSLQLTDAREKLQAENGRPPTVPQLAEYLGCSEEDVLEALETGQNYRAYSLNQEVGGGADSEESGTSLDHFMSVEETGYASFENADLIKSVMDKLSDREKAVFRDRMLGSKTQQEVAREFGVSQMTISRLESEIREKFRKEYYKDT